MSPQTAPPEPGGSRPPWGILLAFWTAFAALTVGQVYVYDTLRRHETTVSDLVVWVLPTYVLWAVAMPLIFALARRFPFRPGRWGVALAAHGAASLGVALVHVLLLSAFFSAISPETRGGFTGTAFHTLGAKYDWNVLVYWLILSVYLATEYFRASNARELHGSRLQARTSRLEAELAQAQLLALKAQLHPHFLFNALNSVGLLVDEDPGAAQRMIGQLGDLLRASLAGSARHLVPLEQELLLLERYVEIERFRFEDRLRVEIDCDPEAREARVPALLLQPLVENAVLHGIQPSLTGGTVRVCARREDGWLRLDVTDDGVGLPEGWERRGTGRVGLRNTRERLRTHFGEAHTFAVVREEPRGTRVTVRLPWSGAENLAAAGHGESAHHPR